MTSEGSREIEAAKLRLAAAKKQAASATKNLDSIRAMWEMAKKSMEDAQSQVVVSQKEVQDAGKFLKEAETRWEVIDVEEENAKKRRKISLESEGRNDVKNVGAAGQGTGDSVENQARVNGANGNDGGTLFRSSTKTNEAKREETQGSGSNPPQRWLAAPPCQARLKQPQKKRKFHLTPEAKVALREAVLSAIRHPTGEVDPLSLQRAMAQGIPKQAILSAAMVSRQRDRKKWEEWQLQRQGSLLQQTNSQTE